MSLTKNKRVLQINRTPNGVIIETIIEAMITRDKIIIEILSPNETIIEIIIRTPISSKTEEIFREGKTIEKETTEGTTRIEDETFLKTITISEGKEIRTAKETSTKIRARVATREIITKVRKDKMMVRQEATTTEIQIINKTEATSETIIKIINRTVRRTLNPKRAGKTITIVKRITFRKNGIAKRKLMTTMSNLLAAGLRKRLMILSTKNLGVSLARLLRSRNRQMITRTTKNLGALKRNPRQMTINRTNQK